MSTHAHYLGAFYYDWSSFEFILEMIAKDELGIDPVRTDIVFCSLGAMAKQEIPLSLLAMSSRPNNDVIAKKIRTVAAF